MTSSAQLDQLLKETARGLKEIFGDALDSVILYGSYARGEQTAESDVDVMAKLNLSAEAISSYRRRVSALASELGLRYDVLLSVKLQEKEKFDRYFHVLPFYQNVARDGVVISA